MSMNCDLCGLKSVRGVIKNLAVTATGAAAGSMPMPPEILMDMDFCTNCIQEVKNGLSALVTQLVQKRAALVAAAQVNANPDQIPNKNPPEDKDPPAAPAQPKQHPINANPIKSKGKR
jgi:hypothetical protein